MPVERGPMERQADALADHWWEASSRVMESWAPDGPPGTMEVPEWHQLVMLELAAEREPWPTWTSVGDLPMLEDL